MYFVTRHNSLLGAQSLKDAEHTHSKRNCKSIPHPFCNRDTQDIQCYTITHTRKRLASETKVIIIVTDLETPAIFSETPKQKRSFHLAAVRTSDPKIALSHIHPSHTSESKHISKASAYPASQYAVYTFSLSCLSASFVSKQASTAAGPVNAYPFILIFKLTHNQLLSNTIAHTHLPSSKRSCSSPSPPP